MTAPFRFQQFTVHQSQAAFKVGTDSVMLGAWANPLDCKNILDIGAGTGLLSLMMAQRFPEAKITSIEMDKDSFEDCANNFALSNWKDNLSVLNMDLVNWSNSNKREKFDLIISNPPYFVNSLQSDNKRKMNARHSNQLLDKLPEIIDRHLTDEGFFAFILPSEPFVDLWENLKEMSINAQRICNISSYKNGKVIRKLGLFSKKMVELETESQFIYNDDKTRSDWYAEITSEFYLKKP